MDINNYSGLDLKFILTPSILISAVTPAATDDICRERHMILTTAAIIYCTGALKPSKAKCDRELDFTIVSKVCKPLIILGV